MQYGVRHGVWRLGCHAECSTRLRCGVELAEGWRLRGGCLTGTVPARIEGGQHSGLHTGAAYLDDLLGHGGRHIHRALVALQRRIHVAIRNVRCGALLGLRTGPALTKFATIEV